MTNKEKIKQNLIKNYLYSLSAYMLAIFGFFTFIYLYNKFVDGNSYVFIQNPLIIIILLAPFIPSAVLFLLSKKARKAASAEIKEQMGS